MSCRKPNCCCDKCDHLRLDCHQCCKCIPISLVAIFRPSEYFSEEGYEGSRCYPMGGVLIPNEELFVNNTIITNPALKTPIEYFGAVNGINGKVGIRVTLETSPYDYEECRWHVFSELFEIDEYFPAGNRVNCREFSWTFDVSMPVDVDRFAPGYEACDGTLSIFPSDLANLRYEKRDPDNCYDYYCSDCKCTCSVLCVDYYNADGTLYDQDELEWNEYTHCWEDEDSQVCMKRDSETGECYVTTPYGPADLNTGESTICDKISGIVYEQPQEGYVSDFLIFYCQRGICEKSLIPCCENPRPDILFAKMYAWMSDVVHEGNDLDASHFYVQSMLGTLKYYETIPIKVLQPDNSVWTINFENNYAGVLDDAYQWILRQYQPAAGHNLPDIFGPIPILVHFDPCDETNLMNILRPADYFFHGSGQLEWVAYNPDEVNISETIWYPLSNDPNSLDFDSFKQIYWEACSPSTLVVFQDLAFEPKNIRSLFIYE